MNPPDRQPPDEWYTTDDLNRLVYSSQLTRLASGQFPELMSTYTQGNNQLLGAHKTPDNLQDIIDAETSLTRATGFSPARLETRRVIKDGFSRSEYLSPIQTTFLREIQPSGMANGAEVVLQALVDDTGETNSMRFERGDPTTSVTALISIEADSPHEGTFHLHISPEGQPPTTQSGTFKTEIESPRPTLDQRLGFTAQQATHIIEDARQIVSGKTPRPTRGSRNPALDYNRLLQNLPQGDGLLNER
jgi:hypothetical protein